MKTIYSIDEFEELFEELQPKHIALFNTAGEKMITYNGYPKGLVEKKLIDILKTLRSKHTEDGVYLVKSKSRLNGDMAIQNYYVRVGELEQINESGLSEHPTQMGKTQYIIEKELNPNSSGLSVQQVIEIKTSLNKLTLENEALKRDVERLEGELSEYESLEEPETNNNQEFFKSLAEHALPLFDKLLSQKDSKQELERARLTMEIQQWQHKQNNTNTPIQQTQQQQPNAPQQDEVFLNENFPIVGEDLTEQEIQQNQTLRHYWVNDQEAYTQYCEALDQQEAQ